jgi:phospholipase/lecithinase/hemolysin
VLVTWIGINDVIQSIDTQTQMTALFNVQASLYDTGARNFIFITVPPMDRTPWASSASSNLSPRELPTHVDLSALHSRISSWNSILRQYARKFLCQRKDANVWVWDSQDTVNAILDNPQKYGFRDALSSCRDRECVWRDTVHPTFATQRFLAHDIAGYIQGLRFTG